VASWPQVYSRQVLVDVFRCILGYGHTWADVSGLWPQHHHCLRLAIRDVIDDFSFAKRGVVHSLPTFCGMVSPFLGEVVVTCAFVWMDSKPRLFGYKSVMSFWPCVIVKFLDVLTSS
jgi:hypothetical protein